MTRKMLSLISLRALCLAMLIALTVPIHADAQGSSVRFESLSLKEGLSESVVNVFMQDSKGFIWFGTRDGLNKCDG